MGVYKVIKDFPSRNGVRQYKAGSSVELDANSRTKALLEMGYISKRTDNRMSEMEIANAILSSFVEVKEVGVKYIGYKRSRHFYELQIKEVGECE